MRKLFLTTFLAIFCLSFNVFAEDFVLKGKMKEMVEKLDAKSQQAVLTELKKNHQKNIPLRDKLKANRDDIKEIMKAEKFNSQAFLAKSADARRFLDEMGSNRAQMVATIAPYFPAKNRVLLTFNDAALNKMKDKAKSKTIEKSKTPLTKTSNTSSKANPTSLQKTSAN